MKKTLILLSALLLTPAVAFAQEEIQFEFAPVTRKQTLTNTESQTMKMIIDIFADEEKLGTMTGDRVQKSSIKVTLSKWSSKKKAAFFEYSDHGSMEKQNTPDGRVVEKPLASPMAGKAFSASWNHKTDTVVITSPDGSEPSEAERARVMKDWESTIRQTPGPLEKTLAARAIKVGEVLAFDSDTMSELLSLGDSGLVFDAPTLTLNELKEHDGKDCAVFDMNLSLTGFQDGMNLSMKLTGQFVVGIDNLRLYEVSMMGPISLEAEKAADGKQMRIAGTGDATFNITRTFEK